MDSILLQDGCILPRNSPFSGMIDGHRTLDHVVRVESGSCCRADHMMDDRSCAGDTDNVIPVAVSWIITYVISGRSNARHLVETFRGLRPLVPSVFAG